jgi:putative peptidoglycan lipid II flippase
MKVRFARIAFLITLITLVSKLLGFARDVVMAAVFGATDVTDAFVMATSINGVFSVMLLGALGTTFLPVYSETMEKKDEASQRSFLNTVYTVSFAVAGLLCLVVFLFPRFLVGVFAPEFSPETAALTATLLRILVPLILLTLAVTLDTVVLQVHGSFLAAVALGIPSNLITIGGMLLLTRGFGVYSLAISTIVGIASQVALVWLVKRKYRLPYRPAWNLKDEGVRRIGILVIPILLGSGISQINTFVDRSLASGLPDGSIAALNFSNRLSLFVLGLISASVVSVFYASMSKLTATGQDQEYKTLLRSTVNGILLLLVPATAGMIVLRLPIIRLIYERGLFDAAASEMTATAMLFYAIGLVGFALRDVLARAFYARKDTRTAMINGLLSVGVNVVFALLLTPVMGIGGLALAGSISGVAGTLLLGYSLYRRIGDFGLRRIRTLFLKVSAASLVMALAASGLYGLLSRWTGSNTLSLAATVLVAIGLYAALVLLFRVDEARRLLGMVLSRLGRTLPVPMPPDTDTGM